MAKKMIRPIRSESDYEAALKEIERYFENEPKPGTPEADRFDLLALIIEDYERKRWPIEPPDTIEAIRYRMETGGYTQADLGRLLGSRQSASDILTRKRPLTMRMAWKLHREWGIPAEALIAPPQTRGRKSARGTAASLAQSMRLNQVRLVLRCGARLMANAEARPMLQVQQKRRALRAPFNSIRRSSAYRTVTGAGSGGTTVGCVPGTRS